jgi:hypothetical protein
MRPSPRRSSTKRSSLPSGSASRSPKFLRALLARGSATARPAGESGADAVLGRRRSSGTGRGAGAVSGCDSGGTGKVAVMAALSASLGLCTALAADGRAGGRGARAERGSTGSVWMRRDAWAPAGAGSTRSSMRRGTSLTRSARWCRLSRSNQASAPCSSTTGSISTQRWTRALANAAIGGSARGLMLDKVARRRLSRLAVNLSA